MNSEVAWVLVSSGTKVQPQIILHPDHLPEYLSVSYDYDWIIKLYNFNSMGLRNSNSFMHNVENRKTYQWRIQRFFGHTVTCKTSGLREAATHIVAPY